MSRVPLVGDVRANLATESIEIEFDPETLPVQMRKIDSNRFDIEAAGKRESGEGKTVVLPAGGAAKLRKCLPDQRRRNCELSNPETTCFNFAGRECATTQQKHCRAVLDAKVDLFQVHRVRQQFLPDHCAPLRKR